MISQHPIQIGIHKYSKSGWVKEHRSLPVEMPVTLTVNGDPWLEFMCTPEYLEALAVGFLFNEGLINNGKEIAQVRVCPSGDNVDIWTLQEIAKPIRWRRTSGCSAGVTSSNDYQVPHGSTLIPAPRRVTEDNNDVYFSASQINELVIELFQAQKLHHQSGGIHASALTNYHKLLLLCEDIGRHNTLDKLAGRVLLEKNYEPPMAVLTTGRISSEMLQKVARMGIGVIVSVTAPTLLAVELAISWDITVIGYAHGEQFKIYTHPERIEMH